MWTDVSRRRSELLVDAASVESFGQLRPVLQQANSLLVAHPPSLALVLLRPLLLDLVDGSLKEVVCGFRCLLSELVGFPFLGDLAQVGVNFADGASFFPGLAAGGFFDGLIDFPTAFREDPAAAAH